MVSKAQQLHVEPRVVCRALAAGRRLTAGIAGAACNLHSAQSHSLQGRTGAVHSGKNRTSLEQKARAHRVKMLCAHTLMFTRYWLSAFRAHMCHSCHHLLRSGH